ncbi:ABC transporter ATP-binding protein [Enterococcus sp. 10A9_DIV0425]|uniref:ABC transporter ATP-binding protein n=1 Tax=Candidatus Enterococcus wittei TaxID=1987383 RepID=A0A242JXT8_9ENTE|nr:ATP-binding cassette domain-containing protein [Enterococcus sp. 10A9_DIV0425]OTP10137.1 ABC transporter ATP-binding protein [Enterococcus sp. 10A9_DIV0425]THE14244.1 ATP-binding cassette domain-containing protein [Enterococcus hirae]
MIELQGVSVSFQQQEKTIHAVKNVDLTIEKGDVYGIVGYSGAGKSTLVRVMNFLQKPTSGKVVIDHTDLGKLSNKDLRGQRKTIGMIFQHFNLMERRTIFDNVDFSLKYTKKSKQERRQKVNELLAIVGLEDKASAYPKQLSGGQKQRVAIARALANDPQVLLCDEATSALDPKTTHQILALLKKLNQRLGLTIVLITHEMQVVKEICNKVAVMEKGEVIEKGSSIQIFSQPKEELTKEFIRTATHIDQALETIRSHPAFADQLTNKWLVELKYVGNQTNAPLIAQLYSKYQVSANILYGNVELLQETPLGQLIVTLSGENHQREKALAYLVKSGVQATILQKNEVLEKIKIIKGGR